MGKIIYIDMDGVLCDFEGAKQVAILENPKLKYPHSKIGFYRNLAPLPGALEAMKALHASSTHMPYILTAPSIYNPACYTEKRLWVEDHLGFDMVSRLIISPDKSLLKGDILIDDNVARHGQDRFDGDFIHFGSAKFPDWTSVLKYVLVG